MNKKIFYVLTALCALAVSCKPASEKNVYGAGPYTVTGRFEVPNEDSTYVFLTNPATGDTVAKTLTVDSTFTFTGETDAPVHVRINFGNTSSPFFLETGDITFDTDECEAYGTPYNEAKNALDERIYKARGPLNEVKREMLDLPANATAAQRKELDLKYQALRDAFQDSVLAYRLEAYNENKDNILGAYFFGCLPMDTFLEMYDSTSATVKEFYLVKNMMEYYDTIEGTKPGKMFKDFTIEHGNLDGSPASLSDYVGKGKYVIVDFWASWCGPCRGETPNLRKVYDKYHGDKFDVVSVAVWDKREATLKAIEEDDIVWNTIVEDTSAVSCKLYGIDGIPQIMLIGPDGIILERDLRGDAISAKVASVLGE